MQINPQRYARLKERLKLEERYRQFIYKDIVGVDTIGYGRNLQAKGISKEEANYLLANDLLEAEIQLLGHVPVYKLLDSARQDTLLDMTYNLGIGGLLGFKTLLACLEKHDYSRAAAAMLDSKWHQQVGKRADFWANIMQHGE